MPDFSQPAPIETEKVAFLHDRSTRPEGPKKSMSDYGRYMLLIGLTILFACGLTAMGFEARSSWESHRDWVVPLTLPFFVIGGLSLAYLMVRQEFVAAMPGIVLAIVTCAWLVGNIYRRSEIDGSDAGMDALSILSGVTLALTILALVIAFLRVELTRPQQAPKPEM